MPGSILEFKEAKHEYYLNGERVPGVTEILSGVGLLDYSSVPKDKLEHSQLRGTHVHKACYLFNMGNLDMSSLDSEVGPYVESWIKLKEMMKIVPVIGEVRICSEKWQYAGTADIYFHCGKALVIGDYKTPDERRATTKAQLAGYGIAWKEWRPKQKFSERWAIHLQADGHIAEIEPYNDPIEETYWLGILTDYRFRVANNLIQGGE